MFESLTRHIDRIEKCGSFGTWQVDRTSKGTLEDPIQLPFVDYGKAVLSFEKDFLRFVREHPELGLSSYYAILGKNGLAWEYDTMKNADVDALDAQCVLALITGAFRAERFSEGALLSFFKDGCILKWLKRLKALDDAE